MEVEEEDEEENEDNQRNEESEGAVGDATRTLPKIGRTSNINTSRISVTRTDIQTARENSNQQQGARPKVPTIIQAIPERQMEYQNSPNLFTVVSRANENPNLPTVCISTTPMTSKKGGSKIQSLPITNGNVPEGRDEIATRIVQETEQPESYRQDLAINRQIVPAVPFALPTKSLPFLSPEHNAWGQVQCVHEPCHLEVDSVNMVDVRHGPVKNRASHTLEDFLPEPNLMRFGRTRPSRRTVQRGRPRRHENSEVCVFRHRRCGGPPDTEVDSRRTEPHDEDEEPPHRTEREDMSPESD